jgi:hypothetical protein
MFSSPRFLQWTKESLPQRSGDYICWDMYHETRRALIRANSIQSAAEFYGELMRCEGVDIGELSGVRVLEHTGQLWSVQIRWVPRPRYVATDVRILRLEKDTHRFIGTHVEVNTSHNYLVVTFADHTKRRVPFTWFTPSGTNKANFNEVEIIDDGQTLRLGQYEVDIRLIHDLTEYR